MPEVNHFSHRVRLEGVAWEFDVNVPESGPAAELVDAATEFLTEARPLMLGILAEWKAAIARQNYPGG